MDSDGNKDLDEKAILKKAKRSTRWGLAIEIGINMVFYILEFGVIMLVIAIEAPKYTRLRINILMTWHEGHVFL